MGRIAGCLGQSLDEPSIAVQGDGSQIITYAPDSFSDPVEVYVGDPASPGQRGRNRTLFGRGHGGVANVNWIGPGGRWQFDMETAGRLVYSVLVDWTGPAISQYVTFGGGAAGTEHEIDGRNAPVGPATSTGASWFESSTNIFGVDVPNLALVGGGGLLLFAALRKRG